LSSHPALEFQRRNAIRRLTAAAETLDQVFVGVWRLVSEMALVTVAALERHLLVDPDLLPPVSGEGAATER
jgi:hypothetical protein